MLSRVVRRARRYRIGEVGATGWHPRSKADQGRAQHCDRNQKEAHFERERSGPSQQRLKVRACPGQDNNEPGRDPIVSFACLISDFQALRPRSAENQLRHGAVLPTSPRERAGLREDGGGQRRAGPGVGGQITVEEIRQARASAGLRGARGPSGYPYHRRLSP